MFLEISDPAHFFCTKISIASNLKKDINNNLYGWAMSQKHLMKKHLNEDRIKIYNEDSNIGYVLEVDVKYHEYCMSFIMIHPFYMNK